MSCRETTLRISRAFLTTDAGSTLTLAGSLALTSCSSHGLAPSTIWRELAG